jgi:hypothetical protein
VINPRFPDRLPRLRPFRATHDASTLRDAVLMFFLTAAAVAGSVLVGLWLAVPLLRLGH